MRARTRAPQSTRQRILQTAHREFYRHGFQGGSLNRIIDDAGVTKGALFHHYDGKQALGFAVVENIVALGITDRWIKPLSESIDPVHDIQSIVRGIVKQKHQGDSLELGCPLNNLAQEMSPLDEGFRRRIEKIYNAWRESVEAAFARGLKAGRVRRGVAPRRLAAFVVAAMTGIVGTAKNAQSGELMAEAGEALIQYLESLLP